MNQIVRAGHGALGYLRENPAWVFLLCISLAAGLVLLLPEQEFVALAILAIAPLIFVQMAIIRNLFLGVALYLIFVYLQPGFRIAAIAAIRPTLLISAALLTAWILNVIRHRVPVVINWQVKAYLMLLVLGFFSLFVAISKGMVAEVWIDLAKTFVTFWVMFSVVRTPRELFRITWLYAIIHILLSIGGFSLFVTGGERRFGDLGGNFLGDENDAAMALLIMIPYMYFLLPITRRTIARLALIGGMALSGLTVLFSFSRGAFVGFLVMVFYMWAKSEKKVRTGVALLAVLAIFFAIMPPAFWQRIESVKNYSTEGSAQGRLDAWKGGIQMMLDNPLFGCGIGNFQRTYGERYNTISLRWTAAHSMYIDFIGQLGVPGIIYLLAVIALTLHTFRRARDVTRYIHDAEAVMVKQIMLGAECGFVTYLIATAFLSSMEYPHLWHFMAMSGMGLTASRFLAARKEPDSKLREIPVAPELP